MIYFDQAATTFPKPPEVYEYADEFYRKWGGNPGRGMNPLARKSKQLLEDTRHRVAELFEVKKAENITFFPSVTIALNQALFGLKWEPGEVILISPFEHNAIARSVERLKERGILVEKIPYLNGVLHEEKYIQMLQIHSPKAVIHIRTSNVTGDMFDIERVANLAKQHAPRTVVIVDDAQTAGLYPLSLQNSSIDLYAFSGHKSLYGPMGIAGLISSEQTELFPLILGGTGTQSEQVIMPETFPDRLEVGSHNVYALAGLNAAVGWINKQTKSVITERVEQHVSYFLREIKKIFGIEYIKYQPKQTVGTVAIRLLNLSPQQVETFLGSQKVCVRAGLHCAPYMHQMLGTIEKGGAVRFSFGYFNTKEEIDLLLEYLEELVDM